MKNKNLIIYIIICLIIIAGLAVWQSKGFRTEIQYTPRKQIQLTNYTGINISDVESIASEVLGNTTYIIQPVETFGNAVSIVSKNMTEEQRDKIVEKFNEKYNTKLEKEKVVIYSIPHTRVKDILKRYIVPGIATLCLVIVYFAIRFSKIGCKRVIAKTMLVPIVSELIVFSIMSIARIPFSRLAVATGLTVYLISLIALTVMFENQRNRYIEELENNK